MTFSTSGHKGFHVVNVPSVMSYLINIAMKATSDKMRKRIKVYNSFDDESFDVIDKKCLPKEYGGTVPMEEMSSKVFQVFLKNQSNVILSSKNNCGN